MPTPKYMHLVAKSRAACLSAVETYNRASALYREETFAILMINAWELILKARIMRENGGKVSSLHEMRPRKKKDGSPSKLKESKLTRSGTHMTIGIDRCCHLVSGFSTHRIDSSCIANIEALLEIRDNATHFICPQALLRKALTEISLAAVRNYVTAAQSWFSVSFADLNMATVPISFALDQNEVDAVAKKSAAAVTRFLAHIRKVESSLRSEESDYAFVVQVDFQLTRKKDDGSIKSSIVSSDPDLKLIIEADKVPAAFTLTHEGLLAKIKSRYSDFKQNSQFNNIMKKLKANDRLYYERYLDPANKKSGKKGYYSTNILKEFDAVYTRKGATLFEPNNGEVAA